MSSTFIRRLSSATTSSSATSADDSDCEHQFMVPMRHYGSKTSSIVHEGHFHCPTVEEVNNQIESFERRRLEFNQLQVTNPIEWDRKVSHGDSLSQN